MSKKRRCPPLPLAPHFSSRLYIRLEPSQTRFFRYLLEGRDNLGYCSVIDRKACILKLVFSPQQDKEFREALAEIARSVDFAVLPVAPLV